MLYRELNKEQSKQNCLLGQLKKAILNQREINEQDARYDGKDDGKRN